MNKPRRGWMPLIVALAVCVAFYAGAAVMVRLDSLWKPPGPHELTGKLVAAHVFELLEQTGALQLSGGTMSATDRKTLEVAGVHDVSLVRDGDAIHAVRFEFGGADNHYGLLVTPDSRATNIGCTITPLKPTLWYYSELPPRRASK